MKVVLIGVMTECPLSAVGDANKTICSRRLAEDLFFGMGGRCMMSSVASSSILFRWSVVAVVAVIGLDVSEMAERMSIEGGDLSNGSRCLSPALGSSVVPNLKSLSRAGSGGA